LITRTAGRGNHINLAARLRQSEVGEIMMATAKTDPARFEVVKNALYSVAEEMKIVLAKTAYSPLLKVAGDSRCRARFSRRVAWRCVHP
jgi:hypothetical protein